MKQWLNNTRSALIAEEIWLLTWEWNVLWSSSLSFLVILRDSYTAQKWKFFILTVSLHSLCSLFCNLTFCWKICSHLTSGLFCAYSSYKVIFITAVLISGFFLSSSAMKMFITQVSWLIESGVWWPVWRPEWTQKSEFLQQIPPPKRSWQALLH